MSRSVPYRREISDACNWHQEQALNSTIYILYQTGPTGFLLNEEGETRKFKVFLGDIHNCTCSVFRKEKDLCKHICWVILKKFRISRDDPLTWQLGLNEREINQIIRGDAAQNQQKNKPSQTKNCKQNDKKPEEASSSTQQRELLESDVCPICQDEFLSKKLPVSFCRTCGNNVHIKCMKVWSEHQKSNGEIDLKCPLCREVFCSFELLDQEYRNNSLFKIEKENLHYGIVCQCCKSTPISGKCYKCTSCNEFYLCQPCFNTDFHNSHTFVFREKISQKYRKATRDHVGPLPHAIIQSLETRELSEQDYELLLQLNPSNGEKKQFSSIPERVIKSWKTEKVRQNSPLLNPGFQCRICLRPYQLNQIVRKLPDCKHKFHLDCIDNWLLHSHPTCPIDGLVVWDPITAQMEQEEKKAKAGNACDIQKKTEPVPDLSFGIIINNKSNFQEIKNESKAKNDKFKSKINQRAPSTDKKQHLTDKNLRIEIEGKNLNLHPNDSLIHTRTILPKILTKQKNSSFMTSMIGKRSNSTDGLTNIGFHNNIFDNLFNMNTLLNSKPYQLTRLPAKVNHQSDFYDNDEDYENFEELDQLNENNSARESIKIDDYESIRSNLSTNNADGAAPSRTRLSNANIEFNQGSPSIKQANKSNSLAKNRLKIRRLNKTATSAKTAKEIFEFPLVQGINLNQKAENK